MAHLLRASAEKEQAGVGNNPKPPHHPPPHLQDTVKDGKKQQRIFLTKDSEKAKRILQEYIEELDKEVKEKTSRRRAQKP